MTGRNEDTSRKSAGVWIDHREAVLVFATRDEKEVVRISSDAERHPGAAGVHSNSSSESHHAVAGDIADRRFTGQLSHFYDEVIAKLAGTHAILVLGPGEAKGEFMKALHKSQPTGRTVTVEAAAKMSDAQLVKKVREHFELSTRSGQS